MTRCDEQGKAHLGMVGSPRTVPEVEPGTTGVGRGLEDRRLLQEVLGVVPPWAAAMRVRGRGGGCGQGGSRGDAVQGRWGGRWRGVVGELEDAQVLCNVEKLLHECRESNVDSRHIAGSLLHIR